MWTLGKWIVLTKGELQEAKSNERALGYQAGLRSKWRMKKDRTFVDPMSDVTALLAAVEDGVVLPQRAA
jgi:hypothetical protein